MVSLCQAFLSGPRCFDGSVRHAEFVIDTRGVPADKQLFVSGTVEIQDGEPTIVGTNDAPLLVSNTGPKGFRNQLLRRVVKQTVLLVVVLAVGVLFLV